MGGLRGRRSIGYLQGWSRFSVLNAVFCVVRIISIIKIFFIQELRGGLTPPKTTDEILHWEQGVEGGGKYPIILQTRQTPARRPCGYAQTPARGGSAADGYQGWQGGGRTPQDGRKRGLQ